jgi:hypothetical protein
MSANDSQPSPVTASLDEAMADFASTLRAVLRRTDDLPETVVQRAAVDPLFLSMLVAHRDKPAQLATLLEQTPRNLPKWAQPPSSVLLFRAARALMRWGRAGFHEVDAETFERRRNACLQCPHLGSAGHQLVYKLVADGARSVCGQCGCAIDRKARLPTEECPAAHPTEPGLSRWGEPLP